MKNDDSIHLFCEVVGSCGVIEKQSLKFIIPEA